MTIDEKYKIAAEAISKAGGTPFPPTKTLLKLLTFFLDEDDLDFIPAFMEQKSQTMEQLKVSSGLPEAEIEKMVTKLSEKGVIFNQPNSKGIMVYRLLPLMNVGTFEYTFMGKVEDTPRNREMGALFSQLYQDYRDIIAEDYDRMVPGLAQGPPIDRTVPVHENKVTGKKIIIDQPVDGYVERIMPSQEVKDIINKQDEIAVGHCFCRHHKDLVGAPCKVTDERETCFTFGKSARYTTEHGFARMISREEALDILKRAENAGLVHKAYHPNFDTEKTETSICNCCKCCCGNSIANLYVPIINSTNYLAVVDKELCIGCGTCVERCHTDACYIGDDGKAARNEDHCIGCAVCAAFCPEDAITMIEGERIVRIIPKRRNQPAS